MTVQDIITATRPEPGPVATPANQRLDAITRETPGDAAAVDALIMAAFGPGRYAKTAERLRERAGLSAGFVLRDDNRIVGSVRLWSVAVAQVRAVFLGPITVDAESRRAGLGGDLVAACVQEAKAQGVAGVLLVGDAGYFERFGFVHAPQTRMPGPVDRGRVLWLAITAEPPTGAVRGVA